MTGLQGAPGVHGGGRVEQPGGGQDHHARPQDGGVVRGQGDARSNMARNAATTTTRGRERTGTRTPSARSSTPTSSGGGRRMRSTKKLLDVIEPGMVQQRI